MKQKKFASSKPYGTQIYSCQNVGCENGQGSEFVSEEEAYWQSINWPVPRSCDTCRAWKREQEFIGTLRVDCAVCGESVRVSAKRRISYHKKQGRWDDVIDNPTPTFVCTLCEDNPTGRTRSLREKRVADICVQLLNRSEKERRVHPMYRQLHTGVVEMLRDGGFMDNVSPFDVPQDPEFYERIRNHGDQAEKHGHNELLHILKASHQWAKAIGTDEPALVLSALARLAKSTSPFVVQAMSGAEVIKADLSTGMVVVLTRLHRSGAGSGWRIRTGYVVQDDPETGFGRRIETHVLNKVTSSKLRSARACNRRGPSWVAN